MVDTKQVLKVAATGLVGAIVGVGGAGLTIDTNEDVVVELNETVASLKSDLSLLQDDLVVKENLIKELEAIECPVPEKVIEYVDNGDLAAVMEFIENEIDEDLDVEYIKFQLDAELEAEAWIKGEFINWLKDEDYFDNGELLDNYRKSEVSIKKIYDVEVVDRDFEDLDVELQYEVKLRAKEDGEDKEYFRFLVNIPFEDGEMEDEDIEVEYVSEEE
jgi:hypothetical protein